jgi:hypothetical protein
VLLFGKYVISGFTFLKLIMISLFQFQAQAHGTDACTLRPLKAGRLRQLPNLPLRRNGPARQPQLSICIQIRRKPFYVFAIFNLCSRRDKSQKYVFSARRGRKLPAAGL